MHSPGVSLHSVFKAWTSLDYHSLCVRARDACNCALHQLFIGHQWTVRSFQMQKRNWPTLQSVDSALPSRCDLQYMTFQRVPTGTVHHLNYNWGLGPRLMMEPGGDCEHVFGCGLFPVNQIMEPCRAAQMWGMSAHRKKNKKNCVYRHTWRLNTSSLALTQPSVKPAYKKMGEQRGGLQLCSDYESLLTSPTHRLILNEAKDNTPDTHAHTYTQRSQSHDLNKFCTPHHFKK